MMTDQEAVKLYAFENVPKLTRRELQLENAILNYLPERAERSLRATLEGLFTEQFGLPSRFSLDHIEETRFSEFKNLLPATSLVAVLGAQPASHKAFLWIDQVIAFSLIDRVLGGVGQLPTELKELTHIEEGVLQYLLLKVMHEMDSLYKGANPVHFRLEGLLQSKRELLKMPVEDHEVIAVHLRLQVGPALGFAVLVLPHPLIESVFMNRAAQKSGFMELEDLEKMGHVKTTLWAEIGTVSLTLSEKNQLEKGDVILFDETQCEWVDQQLAGNVLLRVGDGKSGAFSAQLVSAQNPTLVKITDY